MLGPKEPVPEPPGSHPAYQWFLYLTRPWTFKNSINLSTLHEQILAREHRALGKGQAWDNAEFQGPRGP